MWVNKGSSSIFVKQWNQVSNDLAGRIQSRYEDCDGFEDMEIKDELIKVSFKNNNVFVINRQTAKNEIWYSSPISGPSQFAYDETLQSWKSKPDKELYSLIFKDLDLIAFDCKN